MSRIKTIKTENDIVKNTMKLLSINEHS